MKRLILLAAALTLVLGMVASASATPEVAISGNLLVNAVWKNNWNFKDNNGKRNDDQNFTVYERADMYFTITANENLKGVLGFRTDKGQWGEGDFGNDQAGGGIQTDGYGLSIRDAYIDFNWPGTAVNVKAGVQPVSLPAAIGGGSIIQNARAGAAFVSTAFTDNVSLLAGWARLNNEVSSNSHRGELDAWILALPLNFDGISLTPFGAYAPVGKQITYGNVDTAAYTGLEALNGTTGDKIDAAYWLGAAFTMDLFDPFVLKADVNYGKVTADNARSERAGWLFDAALEYKGFDFMTPELFFVYTTG